MPVTVAQVGIGEFINYDELKSVASAPADSNVLIVNNFTALANETRLHIANLLCNSQSLVVIVLVNRREAVTV